MKPSGIRLLQYIPQMLDQIEIWGIWKFVMFLKPFLKNYCSVLGSILLKVDTIRDYDCPEGVYLVFSYV